MISFHKEQNPPDQLRDIHRGGDIVVHALMPVFIFLFLTVSKNKIAATPENIGVVAILTVVLNYSILFPSFTFFLDGFHLAFGDKFEICIKTTDLM